MGIFDQAKKLAENQAVTEKISDTALDKAAEVAQGKLGEGQADKIKQVRDVIDQKIGE